MFGKDYAQIVDVDLDERYSETESMKDSLEYLLDEVKRSSRHFRERHIDLIGALEEQILSMEAELEELECEIREELDSVGSSYCD